MNIWLFIILCITIICAVSLICDTICTIIYIIHNPQNENLEPFPSNIQNQKDEDPGTLSHSQCNNSHSSNINT